MTPDYDYNDNQLNISNSIDYMSQNPEQQEVITQLQKSQFTTGFVSSQDQFILYGKTIIVFFKESLIEYHIRDDQKSTIIAMSFPGSNNIIPEANTNDHSKILNSTKHAEHSFSDSQRTFSKITYNNLFDGIHLEFSVDSISLKYSIIVNDFDMLKKLKISLSNTHIELDENELCVFSNDLGFKIWTDTGLVLQNERRNLVSLDPNYQKGIKKPHQGNGIENIIASDTDTRLDIPVQFVLFDSTSYGFSIDPEILKSHETVIIDPYFIYSSYLGGSDNDYGIAISVDSQDNIIVTGYTESTDFPTLSAYQNTRGGLYDSYISKFSSNGILLWSTYLGGSGDDYGGAVSVDSNDNIIVTGITGSSDFPTLNAYDDAIDGTMDAFITKFASNGTLLWSTYLGGNGNDYGTAISVDSQDDILVSGYTYSTDFPTLNAYDDAIDSTMDAFITKISSNGTLLWSTYLGGSDDDFVAGICVDSNDNILVTGTTFSTDFPTLNAYDSTNDFYDAFITKFASDGTLLWSTYLGGSDNDIEHAISVDSNDNIIVTGYTYSTDFPTLNAFDDTSNGFGDAFITKFASDGTLLWSSYLGGSNEDFGTAISVDSQDDILITGYTGSIDFPTLNAYDDAIGGTIDAFITKISSNGTLLWSTYLGGSIEDYGIAISVDSNDNIIVTGYTGSIDFPTLSAYNNTNSGLYDTYITKFLKLGLDNDNDFMPDGWEDYYGLNTAINDADDDLDGDGLSNIDEYNLGTIANNVDTDGDLMTDGWEVDMGLNATSDDAADDLDGDGMPNIYEFIYGLNAALGDADDDLDGDGLTNIYEYLNGLFANNIDSDGDLMTDGWEVDTGLNPALDDSDDDLDGDGMPNIYEFIYGLNAALDDSDDDLDGDGMSNIYEFMYGLNTTLDDADDDLDGDGMPNIYEYLNGLQANFNDANFDLDGDGMPNYFEFNNNLKANIDDAEDDYDGDGLTNLYEYLNGLFANNIDSDGDTMPDGWELDMGLNPALDDSGDDLDGDGMSNIYEYQMGLNVNLDDAQFDLDGDGMPNLYEAQNNLNSTINDSNLDNDKDGMTNIYEYQNQLNSTINDATGDLDNDGLNNLDEFNLGTMANNNDTDGDTMPDGWEVSMGLNATLDDSAEDLDGDGMPNLYEFSNNLNPAINDAADDPDNDGLSNLEEYILGTDPNGADSDGDGVNDGEEVQRGRNPHLGTYFDLIISNITIQLLFITSLLGMGMIISFLISKRLKKI